MPRTLVLLSGHSPQLAALADAIGEGAGSVRFAEVDVRRLPESGAITGDGPADEGVRDIVRREAAAGGMSPYRMFEDIERLAEYDAIVIGASGRDGADEVVRLLARAGGTLGEGRLADRAGAAFWATASGEEIEEGLWPILRSMAALGMLLVPAGPAAEPDSSSTPLGATTRGMGAAEAGELVVARQLGKRAATVAAMVAHVRSHHHHHH